MLPDVDFVTLTAKLIRRIKCICSGAVSCLRLPGLIDAGPIDHSVRVAHLDFDHRRRRTNSNIGRRHYDGQQRPWTEQWRPEQRSGAKARSGKWGPEWRRLTLSGRRSHQKQAGSQQEGREDNPFAYHASPLTIFMFLRVIHAICDPLQIKNALLLSVCAALSRFSGSSPIE